MTVLSAADIEKKMSTMTTYTQAQSHLVIPNISQEGLAQTLQQLKRNHQTKQRACKVQRNRQFRALSKAVQ